MRKEDGTSRTTISDKETRKRPKQIKKEISQLKKQIKNLPKTIRSPAVFLSPLFSLTR
jgi:peptidoglycan hydrolase CwlO-like protein